MEREIFGAGIEPGSPTTPFEIKTLLCWILDQVHEPMSFQQLHQSLGEEGLVNYFELVQSLDRLAMSMNLTQVTHNGIDSYMITDLGRRTAAELANSLPLTIRQKSLCAAKKAMRRERRLQDVKAVIDSRDDGYYLELSIPDMGSELVTLSVFSPTRSDADKMRRRFLNDPVFIYQSILSLLQGDSSVLGEPIASQEELF